MITARFAPKAWMSRNWSVEVPGGPTDCQVAPRSVVRKTVPALPLAQATFLLTAESPRRLAVDPVVTLCHAYAWWPWPCPGPLPCLGFGGGLDANATLTSASAPISEPTSKAVRLRILSEYDRLRRN